MNTILQLRSKLEIRAQTYSAPMRPIKTCSGPPPAHAHLPHTAGLWPVWARLTWPASSTGWHAVIGWLEWAWDGLAVVAVTREQLDPPFCLQRSSAAQRPEQQGHREMAGRDLRPQSGRDGWEPACPHSQLWPGRLGQPGRGRGLEQHSHSEVERLLQAVHVEGSLRARSDSGQGAAHRCSHHPSP